MKRRQFTHLMAFSTGSLPLLSVASHGTVDQSNQDPQTRLENDIIENNANPQEPLNDSLLSQQAVKVDDFIELAKEQLPQGVFEYITTGSAEEVTLRANLSAFKQIKILPPLLHGVDRPDLSTTILKQRISLPVILAPVGAQRMFHPEGALATARAATKAETIFAVSTSAGHSPEEVADAANGPKWFQLYVPQDRAVTRSLVERVERAGYQAIVVTVDQGEWKDSDRRNQFMLPKEMLIQHLQNVGHQGLSDRMSYEELMAFNARSWDQSLTWEIFDWLRSVTRLPLLVKGVLRKEDALKAVSIGLDGIVVSNHGGRRLDGMPASIDMLPEIVDAVGGRTEILMDGGIRRGTDILKALALGAKAVLIGRPHALGLAAAGESGVDRVIHLLRQELENAMLATGCATVGDIDRSLLEGGCVT